MQIQMNTTILRNARRIGFFLALLLLWGVLASAGIWNETLFPSPAKVGSTLWAGLHDGSVLVATAVSLRRVCLGYLVSVVIAIPLGILIARRPAFADTIGALVAGLQTLPSICWLPLALLWFGLNDNAILFVIVMGSLVSMTVAVSDGVKNLPPNIVRAALTMGARRFPFYLEVLLPASLPAILTGMKLGWAYAWRALMSGELLFVSIGLGHLLMMGRELADMSQVLSVMLVIIAIGLFTDRLIFGNAESLVREQFGLDRA